MEIMPIFAEISPDMPISVLYYKFFIAKEDLYIVSKEVKNYFLIKPCKNGLSMKKDNTLKHHFECSKNLHQEFPS